MAKTNKSAGEGDEWGKTLHSLPLRQMLIAEILNDTSPEMTELYEELRVLDALNIGVMGAEARTANSGVHVPLVSDIARRLRVRLSEIEALMAKRLKKRA